MSDVITLWQKATTGTGPEPWEQVGSPRRVHHAITRMSDAASLNAAQFYDPVPTHTARVRYDEDYKPDRWLRRERDAMTYRIVRALESGYPGRRGRRGWMRLLLSAEKILIP